MLSISDAEDRIFTRRRLSLFGSAFLAANIAAFAIRFIAGKWLFGKGGNPAFTDFLDWWVGGQFALRGDAAGAYNYSLFSAAQASVLKSPPPVTYFHYSYPPTMLLL